MTDISALQAVLQWKLLKGSHTWPGPDGGTCILEAAIVVAGLPYRRVSSADDAPSDFCWVVSQYLGALNDVLPDRERQRLIPFLARLPGSTDHYRVENQRLDLIVTETVRRILPSLLEALKWTRGANLCRGVPAGLPARYVFDTEVAKLRASGALRPQRSKSRLVSAAEIVLCAGVPDEERRTLVDRVIAIVDEALKVGKQAEPIEVAVATARLERARSLPPPVVGQVVS